MNQEQLDFGLWEIDMLMGEPGIYDSVVMRSQMARFELLDEELDRRMNDWNIDIDIPPRPDMEA